MPWLPGGRPVPSVARLTGVVLGHGAERSPDRAARGAASVGARSACGAEQVGPEAVDEQDRDPAGAPERGGEVQRVGREVAALRPATPRAAATPGSTSARVAAP